MIGRSAARRCGLLVGLLYAIPIALLAAAAGSCAPKHQREDAAEAPRRAPARRGAARSRRRSARARRRGPLAAALRELGRLAGADPDNANTLLAKLETESFSQSASTQPLSADLRSDAAGLLRRWIAEARRARRSRGGARAPGAAAAILAGLGLALAGSRASAAPASDDARAAYHAAMQRKDSATARKAAFARAETLFGEAARAAPDRPELLADWGTAALNAGDVATATLAYRRALAIDASNARARHNLAWLRARQPDNVRPVDHRQRDDTLLSSTRGRARGKLLVGSAAFAFAILLVVPWSGRHRRGLVVVAVLPLAVWIAMLASLRSKIATRRCGRDGRRRAARCRQRRCTAALAQPLARGVELTVLERRDAWTKVRLAGGSSGWSRPAQSSTSR